MFTLFRERYGVSYQIPVIYINSLNEEYSFDDITVTSTLASETLSLVMAGSMRFVADSVEYVAPFDGSDFLTEKTGTLYLTITEDLDTGLHQTYLLDSILIPGVCGFGVLGTIQGGQVTQYITESPIVVQVQALPENWLASAQSVAQPYIVSTIIRS